MSKENAQIDKQPGLALKHAREKSGLSLAHISEQTRISASRLEALEETDYAVLGGAAYATGYTRAYCKVIEVDPAPFVEAFEADISTHVIELKSTDDIGVSPTIPKNVLWIAAVLGLVLVIVMVWLFSGDDESAAHPPAPLSPSPGSAVEGEIETTQSPLEIAEEMEVVVVDMPDPKPALQPAPEPVPPPDPERASNPTSAPLAQPVSLIDQVLDDAMVSDETPVVESPPKFIDAAVSSLDRIALVFAEECWLQVRDASGQRIAMLTAQAGDELVYEGQAPFSVTLGNARAAKLSLNGEPFTFELRPGARTLKLAVGSGASF